MAICLTKFHPPRRRRVHEDVAEQLRDAILDGDLPPGSRLPPERELADRFKVNRTSLRQAIKSLEGLGLICVRQGDGATVLPLPEASLDVLAPMIYRGDRVDMAMLLEVIEVIRPLMLEMARLAVERFEPEHIATIRRLRDAIADAGLDREERFAAAREVVVVLSDMTRNRVWQILARRTRNLLASAPLRAARRSADRDPGEIVPLIDRCLDAIDSGRPEMALRALHRFVHYIGDLALTLDDSHGGEDDRPTAAAT